MVPIVYRDVLLLAVAFVICGCASPPEVKLASTAQLELTDELSATARTTQRSTRSYFEHLDTLNTQATRLRLATDLVEKLRNPPAKTHDALLDRSAILDYALQSYGEHLLLAVQLGEAQRAVAEAEAAAVAARTATEQDAAERGKPPRRKRRGQKKPSAVSDAAPPAMVEASANSLPVLAARSRVRELETRISQLRLRGFPASDQLTPQLETEIKDLLNKAVELASQRRAILQRLTVDLDQEFAFLYGQIDTMKSAAATVNAWIQQDVTISEEQASELRTSLGEAITAVQERDEKRKEPAPPAPQ